MNFLEVVNYSFFVRFAVRTFNKHNELHGFTSFRIQKDSYGLV